MKAIEEGKFDEKIASGRTELSGEERARLEEEKYKLQEELEKRRTEFEAKGKEILNKFEKDPKKARKEMAEAGIPMKIIDELAPAEKKEVAPATQ